MFLWECYGLWTTLNEHFGGMAYGVMLNGMCDLVRSIK